MSCVISRFFILQVCFLFVSLRLAAQCGLEVSLGDQHDAVCYGTATGSMVAEATGGTKPYTFLLNGTEIVYESVIHYLPAGDYKLIVTDANNCSAPEVNFIIKEPPPITAKVDITDATCGLPNGGAVITPEKGADAYNYRWSDELPHGSSPNNLAPGNYTVTIYYNKKELCQHLENITIVNKGGVKATISNSTNATCFGANNGSATVDVKGTGYYTYLWSPSGGNSATANNLPAGNYSVVATDEFGCTDNASVVIAQPAEIHTTITKHGATCGKKNGDASVVVSDPQGSYTYLWTPGNYDTPNISGLAAGTYTVTITDTKGCTKTDEVIIDAVSFPEITEVRHTDILCNGQQNGTATPVVENGFRPYSFNWTNGSNTYTDSSLQGLGVDTYQLTVKDAKGCTATGSVTINQPQPLAHTVSVFPVTCTNPTGSATVNETGGTTPYTYLWKPGNKTDATVSLLAAGDYVVYVYDKNKCADSAHIKITSTAGLTVTIADISNVTCNGGNNGSATANAIGTSPYSFTWSPAGGNGQTASNLSAGNYIVSVIDQQGCTATATTQITEPARITTQITAVATTCGNNNGSASVMVSGGT
ncbi:MAG: hypothetical protein JWQ09_3416, partial [Segetibacter sp.]|nr:hypothetical protein [Segetibacter sp.]